MTRRFLLQLLIVVNIIPLSSLSGDTGGSARNAYRIAHKATKKLQKAADQLSGINTAALRKLLNENQSLRDQLAHITAQLHQVQGIGAIEVSNRHLILRVVKYSGTFRLSGWVDSEDNWFWNGLALNGRPVPSPLLNMKAVIHKAYLKHFSEAQIHKQAFDHWLPKVGADAQTAVNKAFSDFLSSYDTPPDNFKPVSLEPRLGEPGLHQVTLQVTPVKGNINSKWSIQFQLLNEKQMGKLEVVADLSLNSDQFIGHSLGSALKPVRMFLQIRPMRE